MHAAIGIETTQLPSNQRQSGNPNQLAMTRNEDNVN